jgi:hypothetical protein
VSSVKDTLENRVDELLEKEEAMLLDKGASWCRGLAELIVDSVWLDLERWVNVLTSNIGTDAHGTGAILFIIPGVKTVTVECFSRSAKSTTRRW